MQGKNEVGLEFRIDTAESADGEKFKGDQLVEMRFFIPGKIKQQIVVEEGNEDANQEVNEEEQEEEEETAAAASIYNNSLSLSNNSSS